MLFGAYVIYVLVCANFEAIVALFAKRDGLIKTSNGKSYGSMGVKQMSKVRSCEVWHSLVVVLVKKK